MTRSLLQGLAVAASVTLVTQCSWAVDPRLNTTTNRGTIPASNDPASRLVQPGTIPGLPTQLSSNQIRDRMGNVLVPDPNRFEYNPSRPNTPSTTRVTPNVSVAPLPGSPGTIDPNPATPQQPRWKLGVYSKDTNVGVQVIQVVQNGAAYKAALEKDDTIISVNGFQVGYVNGTLYDCGTEFERLADKNGWVNLLVLDNRTRSLINLPVQLDSRLQRLGGTLTWRDPVNLPARSVAIVEIRERARTNAPTTVVARTEVNQFRPNAIPFEMEYDPGLIDPNRNYFVSAYVLSANNQVIYQASPTSNYQLTNLGAGQTRPVTVAMERVSTGYDQPVVNNNPNSNPGGQVQYVTQEQLETLFQTILERNPTQREMEAWLSSIRSGQSITDVQATLLANNQFFNQCDRDKQQYVTKLHEMLLDRNPTRDELAYWTQRYDALQGVRAEVAREFLQSVSGPN